jgi:hypothetical protein
VKIRIELLGLLLMIFAAAAFPGEIAVTGQEKMEAKKTPYHVPRTSQGIKLDGIVEEEAWREALLLELNYEFEPGENVPAPVKTEFLLTYDKTYLYAAFRCYDPNPAEIRAHLSDRDNDYGDDFVGILLDTFNDERKNIILWSNPHGIQEDAVMTGVTGYDTTWDARYKSAGKITEWGYSVEMAIPFSSIRFQRTNGSQVWGIDAVRNYPRSVLHEMGIVPRDRNNNCYQCQMVKVQGFDGIRPARNIEITPTLTGVRTDERRDMPDGNLKKRNEDAEFGVTARWGITPNLTLNGTVNPDFSQVEADSRKLDINEPFALYYDEKRPFFTEGGEYFDTALNAVYTRTIRDPSWGIKFTGKEGRDSFGAYIVRDAVTNIIFPGSQYSYATSLDMGSTASVLRYKHDFGNKYTMGALFSNRQGTDYYNRVYGFDGTFRITNRDQLDVEILSSSTRYPDQIADDFNQERGRFNDKAMNFNFRHRTKNFNIVAAYQDLGEDFRADLGYIPRVGYREVNLGSDYRWIAKPGKWWNLFMISGLAYRAKEENGNLLYKGIETMVLLNGKFQSTCYVVANVEREAYGGREFDLTYFRTNFQFRPAADVFFALITYFGDRIDYSNIRPGQRFRIYSTLSYSPGNHFRLSFDHTYERMKAESQRLYTANISQGTIIYQFNSRIFFRSILQYVDYNYNADNYLFPVLPEYKHLFVQLLFSYKFNPKTVVFLGYTDNYLGEREFPLTRSDRTFFLKLGYAWQF